MVQKWLTAVKQLVELVNSAKMQNTKHRKSAPKNKRKKVNKNLWFTKKTKIPQKNEITTKAHEESQIDG